MTVENICTVQVNARRVDVLDHVIPQLRVVVGHGQAVGEVVLLLLVFLVVLIDLLLHLADLGLDVVEGPLLRFLHLNHHLLDLLELLETVGLHLLQLLLL